MRIPHRRPPTTARNGTSIAHAATRCMRVCTIFQRLRKKTTEAPSPSQRSRSLVVKANTFVITFQFVSRLHGPQLFMKAGPGRLTHKPEVCIALCCAVHAARDNDNRCCRGGAAACLDALRANEKAGDGRFPRTGNKSNPPRDTWRAPRISVVRPWVRSRSLDCA
jgi:hypothetical protein